MYVLLMLPESEVGCVALTAQVHLIKVLRVHIHALSLSKGKELTNQLYTYGAVYFLAPEPFAVAQAESLVEAVIDLGYECDTDLAADFPLLPNSQPYHWILRNPFTNAHWSTHRYPIPLRRAQFTTETRAKVPSLRGFTTDQLMAELKTRLR